MNAKTQAAILIRDEKAWQELVHAIQYTRPKDSTAHRRGGYSPRESAIFLARESLAQRYNIHATETAIRLAMRKINA